MKYQLITPDPESEDEVYQLLLINLSREEIEEVFEKLGLCSILKPLRAHDHPEIIEAHSCKDSQYCVQGGCGSWAHCLSREE